MYSKEGGPFGTVIVKGGKIIAQGRNHVLADNDPTAHGAKDAGKIGFRDDAIYKWLDKPNKNMLNLIQRDRGMTINSFRKYADSEHTLY